MPIFMGSRSLFRWTRHGGRAMEKSRAGSCACSGEMAEVDALNAGKVRNGGEQRGMLDGARGAEARPDGLERGIFIARMTDQFPHAFRHGHEQAMEDGFVEHAGGEYADGSVRG